ncbi:helix-turn-helix domain-containing protein [Chitinilyticum litopenaei]|uniref:helix-turn-helix domain-containing protein n=1 Tax=Chitinilyticum litopenaei TaxID=1121276 RepID=UPI00040F60B8|nr:helix-turn-helix domain-containing protein [Chitinilyticum litopenaei]
MSMDKPTLDPRSIRKQLGLNQQEFWSRIGVTQSGGSRYESGRAMPKPVQELLRVVHIEGIDLASITRADITLLDHLRAREPALYQQLQDQARAIKG